MMVDPEQETWEDVANKPLPRFVNETPMDPAWLKQTVMPETELQALMEAAPGDEPAISKEKLATVIGRVAEIVETVLSDEERAVIETTVYAGHSVRKAAEILGWSKSAVDRLKRSALAIIERELENE